jgi:hypothetical protein
VGTLPSNVDDNDEDDNGDEGTLHLDPDIICPALDYHQEWTCITRIRLVPEEYASASGVPGRKYRFELVRDGVHGHQCMVITPPNLFYIDSMYMDLDMDTLITDLEEKLHLRYTVDENRVEEFSV